MMDERVKKLLLRAQNPKEAVRIAEKYNYDTEIKKNEKLEHTEFIDISGGKTEKTVTYADYCVVVRDRETGKILCTLPY